MSVELLAELAKLKHLERLVALVGSPDAWNIWPSPRDLVDAAYYIHVDNRAIVTAGVECTEMVLHFVSDPHKRAQKALNLARKIATGGHASPSAIRNAASGAVPEKAGHFGGSEYHASLAARDVLIAANLVGSPGHTTDGRSSSWVTSAMDEASIADAYEDSRYGFGLDSLFERQRLAFMEIVANRIRRGSLYSGSDPGPLCWDVIEMARETVR